MNSRHLTGQQLGSIAVALSTIAATTSLAAQTLPAVQTLPEITVYATAESATVAATPGAMGAARVLKAEEIEVTSHLDEAMVNAGWAAWDAGSSLGLAQGMNVRGFPLSNQGSSQVQASRVLLNGHADIAWRFNRDPATIQSAQLIGGSDATLLGAGSPGGTLLLTSKTTTGKDLTRLQGQTGSNGGKRAVLDIERGLGPLRLRTVVATQGDDKTVEQVIDRHDVALLSASLRTGSGKFQFDVEQHRNQMPFPFGTAYVGGHFWLNQAYVDTRTSKADRNFTRQSLYWIQGLTDDVILQIHAQHADSSRQETLLGFWGPLNATQLSGYYRTIDETNQQMDYGIKLDGHTITGPMQHTWSVAWLSHRQQREFAGPQNIGGFVLDVANPVYPVNPQALPLSNRFAFEDYRETGLGIADRIQWGPWQLRAGLRRASMATDASTTLGLPPAPVSRMDATSYAWGLGRDLGIHQRAWLTHTQSFMPNRGHLANGAWLPESRSAQLEAGYEWQMDKNTAASPSFSATVFDLQQTNLPARDPTNADAYILVGAMQSTGLELQAHMYTQKVQWTASATFQKARVQTPTSAAQGGYLPGVGDRFGALRMTLPLPTGLQAWVQVQASASRPGDSMASFSAPGYAVVGLGLQNPLSNSLHWGIRIDNALDVSYVRALTGADNVWQGPRRNINVWISNRF